MGVKIICENILEESHFLSATEQEGEFWGQPEPNSDNEGAYRLLSKGTPEDFSYPGTTTSAGAGDGTTVIDSVLKAFGDDYFISGSVAITSGACNGESKAVTDFAQATGTITTAAFSAQIASGVTFTLTLAFASRDFRIELIASGDAGDATFRWSHDGGTTYLGRDEPDQATWLNPTTISANSGGYPRVAKMENGNIIMIRRNGSDSLYISKWISTDNGFTWSSATRLFAVDSTPLSMLILQNGRLLVLTETYIFYSDDNGVNWSDLITHGLSIMNVDADMVERKDGVIVLVRCYSSDVYCDFSYDGITYTGETLIAGEIYSQCTPVIELMKNNNLLCVYRSDENSVHDTEIKGRISKDGGKSWGSVIAIADYAGVDKLVPHVCCDINGRLFCAYEHAYSTTYFRVSDDNGLTWSSEKILVTPGNYLRLLLVGQEFWAVYSDGSITKFVKRGMWKTYSSNACPCAVEADEQKLICDAGLVWHGGAGIAEDKWDFEAEYYFSMKNLISGSPSKPWRSEQDNIACSMVIDLGANVRHQADGVAFFGCNLRTLSFQMNASDSWGSPSVDESVSFDMATGIIDAVNGNYIQDTSLLADYKDHELRGEYFRATSGTDSGKTWEILDNVEDYIILKTTAAHNMAATNTFAILQKHISKTFTAGLYRYIRIHITAQETAEGYYQIGETIIGKATELSCGYETGFNLTRNQNISILTTPKGAVVAIPDGKAKNEFQFTWATAEGTRLEILSFINYLRGKNFVLIPDSADLKDCSLLKITGPVDQAHRFMDRYDISVTAREVK